MPLLEPMANVFEPLGKLESDAILFRLIEELALPA